MTTFLGELPTPPTTDWVSQYVAECKLKDAEEDIWGDPEPDDTKQYFEHSIKEIADVMGMTQDGVYSLIKRANAKLARRLLIDTYIDRKTDDEIISILNSGIANVKEKVSWMFLNR